MRDNLGESLAPIELRRRRRRRGGKDRIKKKRVPVYPETHAHSTQTYTPPCVARETSTDSPKTKKRDCWKVEEKQEEGKDRSGRKTH